mgnify:CR=1 FL=1
MFKLSLATYSVRSPNESLEFVCDTTISVDNLLFITFYIALSLFMHNFKKNIMVGSKEKKIRDTECVLGDF